MNRRKWVLVTVIVAVPLVGVALFLFQPWKAFVDTVVDESVPVAVQSPAASSAPASSPSESPAASSSSPLSVPSPAVPVVVSEGVFVSQAHQTQGRASIIDLGDGSYVLRFEDLDTDNGPDLKVWLTNGEIVEGADGGSIRDSEYVDLGVLKGNKGNQNYPLPAGVGPEDFAGVVIWCDRFTVSFGGAVLSPVGSGTEARS